MKIELQGTGAGRGTLLIGGHFAEPESVLIAVERNDGRYLGLHGVWQRTAHWHPQFGVQPVAEGLRLDVGPEVVDGIISVGGVPLRFLIRVDGVEDAGVLRIKGELIGSDGAAPTRHWDGREEPPSLEPGSDESTVLAPPPPFARPPAAAVAPSTRAWLWAAGALLLLAAVTLGAAWTLGWLDPWLEPGEPEASVPSPQQAAEEPPVGSAAGDASSPEPPPDAREVPERVEPAPPSPPPQPAPLKGIAFARDFLASSPAVDALYAQALESDTAGDCEAALVLYNAAADADSHYAAELARRYDPKTFAAGTCIDTADAPYAIVYFEDAARAGDAAAQRRLGQLMTEREDSGATYEEGVAWLRKAAAAGDAEAQRSLDALGK